MKYVIEVTSKVTLEIDADNEDQAIEQACGTAWQYDPDEQNATVVERPVISSEAAAMLEKADGNDLGKKRDRLRRLYEKRFEGGWHEEVD